MWHVVLQTQSQSLKQLTPHFAVELGIDWTMKDWNTSKNALLLERDAGMFQPIVTSFLWRTSALSAHCIVRLNIGCRQR